MRRQGFLQPPRFPQRLKDLARGAAVAAFLLLEAFKIFIGPAIEMLRQLQICGIEEGPG